MSAGGSFLRVPRLAVLLAAGVAGTLSSRADDAYPVADFLRAAVDSSAAAWRAAGASGGAGIPYLRDAEIRVRNESFDLGRQRYSLQLSPKGFGEEDATRRLRSALSARHEAAFEATRDARLKERHLLVVDLLAARALGDLYAELSRVEEERIRVLERQNVTDAFDLGDILKAEGAAGRHLERRDEARSLEALARDRARALLGIPTFAMFDTAGLAGIEEVEAWAASVDAPDTTNPRIRAARRDAEAAEAQYRLAVAENRRFVSFVEIGYDHGTRRNELEDRRDGRDYDLDRAWLIEVGFRLPWGGAGGSNVLRRRVEAEGRRAALRRDAEDEQADLREALAAIRAQAARYRAVLAREGQLDLATRLRRYAALPSADPAVVLTLRQAVLESALRREEARFGMLREYVEAAAIAGEFSRRPARNMLSRHREPLGE